MDLAQPWMIQRIIDDGVAKLNLKFVIQSGAVMIVLALIGAAGGIGCSIFAVKASQGFGADIRAALFRKVQEFSFGNLDRLGTGPLITRLTSDVAQVQEAVQAMLRIMVRAPLMMIGSCAMAILIAPRLAWLPLGAMALVLLSVALIMRRAYPLYGRVQAELDSLNTAMQENLAGMRVVKAFARAAREISRFKGVNARLMDISLRVARVTISTMPVMMILINISVVAVLWIGGVQVSRGDMQAGQIVAFINYLQRALMSLLMVGMMVMQFSRAAASAARIQQSLAIKPRVKNKPCPRPASAPLGRVVFDNVSFSYDEHSGDPALENISFAAENGQTIAILGSTGSGKSTLAHLIPRFYDATAGRIMFDGTDVRDVDQALLRAQISIVLQESILFSGTIRDNIRYGRPDADDEAVMAAASTAQAHDFIVKLPHGYDTILGQRGVNLSGGQKQRIAIARALLMRPAVLILDDSTSAVDIETEARIQSALRDQYRCTRFIITHRISTAMNMDRILVLDDGHLAAEGTHCQLLASSPIYRDFCESQIGKDEEQRA